MTLVTDTRFAFFYSRFADQMAGGVSRLVPGVNSGPFGEIDS